MMEIKPKDCIAALFILILGTLVFYGHNGIILAILGLIAGYYFGDKRSSVVVEPDEKSRLKAKL